MSIAALVAGVVFASPSCASIDELAGRKAATPVPEHHAVESAEPEAAFPAIQRAIDEADALVARDPAAADVKYQRARAALLKLWGEARGGDLPNNRLLRAFGHLDSEREGSEASTLMWRSFLGRERALAALHREVEGLGEFPDYTFQPQQCPSALAAECAAHVERLRHAHPAAFADDGHGVFQIVALRIEKDPNDISTQKLLHSLPELETELAHKQGWVLIQMTASDVTRDASGRTHLELKGLDLPIKMSDGCKKFIKQELVDNHIVIEERCKNVHTVRDPGYDLAVTTRPALDLPEAKWGDIYTLAVPAAKLSHNGRRFSFPDAVIVKIGTERGPRYWFNANLDWSLPADPRLGAKPDFSRARRS